MAKLTFIWSDSKWTTDKSGLIRAEDVSVSNKRVAEINARGRMGGVRRKVSGVIKR